MKLFMWVLVALAVCFKAFAQKDVTIPNWERKVWVNPTPLANTSLAGLLKAADVVVDGTVESVLPSRQLTSDSVETDVRLAVALVIKGSLTSKEIMFSQTGGAIGARIVVPQQYYLVRLGERCVLFLTKDTRASTPHVSGMSAYNVLGAWLGLVLVSDNKIHVDNSPGLVKYEGADVGLFEAEAADIVSRQR